MMPGRVSPFCTTYKVAPDGTVLDEFALGAAGTLGVGTLFDGADVELAGAVTAGEARTRFAKKTLIAPAVTRTATDESRTTDFLGIGTDQRSVSSAIVARTQADCVIRGVTDLGTLKRLEEGSSVRDVQKSNDSVVHVLCVWRVCASNECKWDEQVRRVSASILSQSFLHLTNTFESLTETGPQIKRMGRHL